MHEVLRFPKRTVRKCKCGGLFMTCYELGISPTTVFIAEGDVWQARDALFCFRCGYQLLRGHREILFN